MDQAENKISYKGHHALVERAVIEETTIRLLSMVGTRESVKAIWAALVTNDVVSLETPTNVVFVSVEKAPSKTHKLECGKTHLLMVDPEIIRGQIVIAHNDQDFDGKLWATTQNSCSTPLHASWKDWVINEIQAVPLTVVGNIKAARVQITDDFTNSICNAVRWGVLKCA